MVALFVTVSIECGFNFSVHRRVTRKSGMPRVARVDAVKQKIVPPERILMRTLADAKRYTDIQRKKCFELYFECCAGHFGAIFNV